MSTEAEQLLRKVRDVSQRIADAEQLLARLRAQRVEHFATLRNLDPPVEHRVIGDAAGLTDVGVIAALRRRSAD